MTVAALESVRDHAKLTANAIEQIHRELAEIRDGLVDLDHAKAPVARLNALHTRVDHLAESVAANEDDLAVLRNDYRGEAA